MRKLGMKIATIGISVTVALADAATSHAMQMPSAPVAAERQTTSSDVRSDVQQVQWRGYGGGYYRGGGYGGGYYRGGGWGGGYYRGGGWGGGYYGGGGYYRGYRGYPYYRSGYRYYNNYWYPLAAFGAGALIGGAIASQPRYYAAPADAGINPRHYEWCASRYRSYRGYDNTFQPNYGPRRQCLSPYY